MDNELDFLTKIGVIEVQKRCFRSFFSFFCERGRGHGNLSKKTISLNSHLTLVHTEEKKFRIFQSYMKLF